MAKNNSNEKNVRKSDRGAVRSEKNNDKRLDSKKNEKGGASKLTLPALQKKSKRRINKKDVERELIYELENELGVRVTRVAVDAAEFIEQLLR